MASYVFPADTHGLIEDQPEIRWSHLGLRLGKYVPQAVIGKTEAQRYTWMIEVVNGWNRNEEIAALWTYAVRRWMATTSAAGATSWPMTLQGRMIVGLGYDTVLETGLTLHHTWGIPIIPGSALKGLARAWAMLEGSAKTADIMAVFGSEPHESPLRCGKIIFLDGLPQPGTTKLCVDIMNPHFGDYYQSEGDKPPATYLDPVPIFFLTVEKGNWNFAIAPRPGLSEQEAKPLIEQARKWLTDGLTWMGVGGKTSAGYGFFEPGMAADVEHTSAHDNSSVPAPPPQAKTPPATPPTPKPVRTTLEIKRVDTEERVYYGKPRDDALRRLAQQRNLPLKSLSASSTHWKIPFDAFDKAYQKKSQTPSCEVERVEHQDERLIIWMRRAPRKE